jgi:hypothetical protein
MMMCCCCCRSNRVLIEEAEDEEEPLDTQPVPDRQADHDAEGLDNDELDQSFEYPEESVTVGIN